MPRRPRLLLPGNPLHVTQRGVNRCAIFVDDLDRNHFHDLLCKAMAEHCINVHAYVFMGNHVHLLLTSPHREALSRAMRNFGQCYVQAFNKRHRRSGTLWQGRFKSCLVDTDRYLMAVYRYIELNPVRAAMVALPEQYRWSSVHANLGLREDPLITSHPVFLAQDHDPQVRAAAYRTLLREGIGEDELLSIRAHLEQERALGDVKFQAMIEKALGHPAQLRPRGRPRQSHIQPGDV
jgi:putative transposase